ncbi:ABC transporter substrate-binding protein [Saccharomonospora sp. CUA-673]|uniref:MCE family protein n=1 Tax=Saccharomonospora sp. CUA-673 TaxID=1904969 RepID=UPI0009648D22|nr:MCE family protein [Saccharomonospora sp. CUA-673]OLT48578.1 ABC transporter substrate-binding protein [Saccharomonospora sp. CUA-673]
MSNVRAELLRRLGLQALGVVFLVAAVAFVATTVAIYNKAFSRDASVRLETDTAGNQMREGADVKVRGVLVGEVRSISTDSEKAVLDLAIDPERIDAIPSTVSARLLPKTLFGERYVALQLPEPSDGVEPLAAGDVIPQDRSESAVELERVLSNVLPLVQAVEPQKLSSTLSAVSTALEGRGEQLGDTLVELSEYLRDVQPQLPDLTYAMDAVADVAHTYDEAAPDFLAAMRDLTTTTRTIVEKRESLAGVYESVTGTSGDLERFLAANERNIIGLTTSAQSTLDILAKYAPQYPCMFRQFADSVPHAKAAFGYGEEEMNNVVIRLLGDNRGRYEPGVDEPRFDDKRGPRCYPQMEPPDRFPQYPPEGPLRDGSTHPAPSRNSGPLPGPVLGYDMPFPADGDHQGALYGSAQGDQAQAERPQGGGAAGQGRVSSPVNSPEELRLIGVLQSPETGIAPDELPGWGGVLLGPLYRGTTVELQ